MTTPTLEQIAREVVRLADENPEHTYQPPEDSDSCLYIHTDDDGAPLPGTGCIFGQALQNLGVDREALLDDEQPINELLRDLDAAADWVPGEFWIAQTEAGRRRGVGQGRQPRPQLAGAAGGEQPMSTETRCVHEMVAGWCALCLGHTLEAATEPETRPAARPGRCLGCGEGFPAGSEIVPGDRGRYCIPCGTELAA